MVEGEKLFPIAIRYPERLRLDEDAILNIPVDITNNQVVLAEGSSPVNSPQEYAILPLSAWHVGRYGEIPSPTRRS